MGSTVIQGNKIYGKAVIYNNQKWGLFYRAWWKTNKYSWVFTTSASTKQQLIEYVNYNENNNYEQLRRQGKVRIERIKISPVNLMPLLHANSETEDD